MPAVVQSIFNEAAGTAVKVNVANPAPTVFSLGGGAFRPTEFAITTGVSYSQRVAAQFKQSLRRILYVFPFGDEPSQLAVTLSVFLKGCVAGAGNAEDTTALVDMLKFYDGIKLKPNAAIPIAMTIGGSALSAFCVGMDMDMKLQGLQTLSSVKLSLIGWNLDKSVTA